MRASVSPWIAILLLGLWSSPVEAQAPVAEAELASILVELEERLQDLAATHPETAAGEEARRLGEILAQAEQDRSIPWGWYAFGLLAQTCFFCRFLVQWLASERAGESVVPITFWYFSITGSLMLLTYAAIHLRDPVIILGQSVGSFIYVRNLILIRRKRLRDALRQAEAGPV
jgi:lipid-A-disaccharide synthase-like uncharacterized protein